MSFIIILDFWCSFATNARHHHVYWHDNQFCNCLTTTPILQQHPKSKYTVIYCISAATKQTKKKLWGPWISGQQNFWLLGIVQDSNIVNMSVFRAALTPCWANYPKLFGQTICQMSRALLAHKERKVEEGKTKPAVLSCIPKIPK